MEEIKEVIKKDESPKSSFNFNKFSLNKMKRNPNILIIGGKNIGKTLLTKRILYYLDFYENPRGYRSSRGTIFSPTEHSEYNFVNWSNVNRSDCYTLPLINSIMDLQKHDLSKFIDEKTRRKEEKKEYIKDKELNSDTTIFKGLNNIEIEFTLDKEKEVVKDIEKESDKKKKIFNNLIQFIGKGKGLDKSDSDLYPEREDTDVEREYREDIKKIDKIRSFILFDKCLSEPYWYKNNTIKNLLYCAPYHLLTVIINERHLLTVPKNLQETFDYIFIFNQKSISAKRKIYEDYFGSIETFEKFERIFDSIMELDPYNCLVLDKTSLGFHSEDNIFWYNLDYKNNKIKKEKF